MLDSETYQKHVALLRRKLSLKEQLAETEKLLRESQTDVLTTFERTGTQRINIEGMTIFSTRRLGVKTPDRPAAVVALASDDSTAWMVKEDINLRTVAAWIGELECDDDGHPILPEHTTAVLAVTENCYVGYRQE